MRPVESRGRAQSRSRWRLLRLIILGAVIVTGLVAIDVLGLDEWWMRLLVGVAVAFVFLPLQVWVDRRASRSPSRRRGSLTES